MKAIKWGLAALGAYLLYRWWTAGDEQLEEAGATLPADEGMTDGEGGGGGGGGSSGGDYQAPAEATTPLPAPVKTRDGTRLGISIPPRAPRNAGPVKRVPPLPRPKGKRVSGKRGPGSLGDRRGF